MGFAEHKINCYGYFKILEDNLKIMCKNKKKYKKLFPEAHSVNNNKIIFKMYQLLACPNVFNIFANEINCLHSYKNATY